MHLHKSAPFLLRTYSQELTSKSGRLYLKARYRHPPNTLLAILYGTRNGSRLKHFRNHGSIPNFRDWANSETTDDSQEDKMLRWALGFFVIALVAALEYWHGEDVGFYLELSPGVYFSKKITATPLIFPSFLARDTRSRIISSLDSESQPVSCARIRYCRSGESSGMSLIN